MLTKHLTGIGRFAARLVEALSRLAPLRLINTIGGEHALSMNLSNALPCGQEIAIAAAELPHADADVGKWARLLFHRPRYRHNPELAKKCAMVYTMLRPAERHFRRELCLLHDFTPVLMPKAHVRETREHFGLLFSRSAALCDTLVANSRSTKADARWLCSGLSDNVVVCYPGPTLCLNEHADPGPVSRRKNVMLVVSTLEPRKNGPFLFRWFLSTNVLPSGMELWWVGPSGWLTRSIFSARRRSRHGRRIRFLGVVSDRRLCALYRQAAFTVYPSLYEGFGFPVLDALRHGTPVLSSFNSSLSEFAGPGVFYFDPCDPASLDDAYLELQSAGSIRVEREDLLKRCSWQAMAERVRSLCA